MFKITVTAPENATVTPNGIIKVVRNENKTFKIKANDGYEIEDVLVDGVSVGAVSEYTFEKVKEKHTLEVRAKAIETKSEEDETFVDVKKNEWFYEAIEYVNNKGLMNGTRKNEFSQILAQQEE